MSVSESDDAARLSLRAEPDRLPASRPCALGAPEPARGRGDRRAFAAADRGCRHDARADGIRGGDLRGPRVARARMGGAGAPPARPLRRLREGAGRARKARAALSGLHEPKRNRRGGRQRRGPRLAARSGRRAALSRPRARLVRARRRAEMASGKPYALRLDMARALSGLRRLSWSAVDPFGVEPPTAASRRSRRVGRCRSWRARRCTAAITSQSSWTTRFRA